MDVEAKARELLDAPFYPGDTVGEFLQGYGVCIDDRIAIAKVFARALQAGAVAPTEADVLAAAKRIAGATWRSDGDRLDRSWDLAPDAVCQHYLRMARAALGLDPTP